MDIVQEELEFSKTITLTAAEIDLSLFQEGEPPRNRLFYRQHAPIPGLQDYTITLRQRLTEASNNLLGIIRITQGFTVVKGNSRLYFRCRRHDGKHIVFYENEKLQASQPLQLTWEILCQKCQQIIPRDIDAFPVQIQQQPLIVQQPEIIQPPQQPEIIQQPQQPEIIQQPQQPQQPERDRPQGNQPIFFIQPDFGQNNPDYPVIATKFMDLSLKLQAILNDSYNECSVDANPLQHAVNMKSSVSEKILEAYSEIFPSVDDEIGEPSLIDTNGMSSEAIRQTLIANRLQMEHLIERNRTHSQEQVAGPSGVQNGLNNQVIEPEVEDNREGSENRVQNRGGRGNRSCRQATIQNFFFRKA